MQVQCTPDIETLDRLCRLANREAFAIFERRDSCITTSAALMDVLRVLGINADVMRVCAMVFKDTTRTACSLGSDGDGTRRPAAGPGMWRGHLAVIADGRFLMDATLDQANDTDPDFGAEPFVSEIEPAFLTDRHALLWGTTGPSRVRYYPLPGRGGWKSAPAFRLWQRRDLIDAILSAWEG
jgi:hypothetical protein